MDIQGYKPKKVIVEPESADSPLAEMMKVFGSGGEARAKETVRLTLNKGPAIRSCPGTREYICCGYQILHVGTGCPLNCSYCILQAYLNEEDLRVFTDWDHIAREIGVLSRSHPDQVFRLGTGEFTDSLYLDHLSKFSLYVTPLIQRTNNMVLEFKSKTVNIGNLLKLKNTDRIIVSFSLNSPHIVKSEEHRAASLSARLDAAHRCEDHGFKIGFHFDPLIRHKGWQDGYSETVERMFTAVDPANVIWISLGCLRFMPELKDIIKERFPQSPIIYEEFITGLDGKLRYFNPLRIEMFSFLESSIKHYAPDVLTYLCMESDAIWRNSLGRSPGSSERLKQWLDQRALDFFPSLRRDVD